MGRVGEKARQGTLDYQGSDRQSLGGGGERRQRCCVRLQLSGWRWEDGCDGRQDRHHSLVIRQRRPVQCWCLYLRWHGVLGERHLRRHGTKEGVCVRASLMKKMMIDPPRTRQVLACAAG